MVKVVWTDNIFIERFWRTIKHENILIHSFHSASELKESVGIFIDNYNNKRLHQNLGYKQELRIN